MVALNRKRKAASDAEDATSAKRAQRSHSLEWLRASRRKNINSIPAPKTLPMDLFVWGSGGMGELGLGPDGITDVMRPRLNTFVKDVTDLTCGGMHSLALDKNNQLWSWGINDSGALGRDLSSFHPTEDGESTPGKVEGLPEGVKIVQIAATDNLSVVLLETGDVWAWGTFRCEQGKLGFSATVDTQYTPCLIENLYNIVQLAAGGDHILALDTKGIVYSWGNGQRCQLGRKILERTKMSSFEPRSAGLKNIKAIGSGEFHSFAITHDDRVFAWGLNQFGQCGTGDADGEAALFPPKEITALRGKGVVSITGGQHHSVALTASGDVYAFGCYHNKDVGIPEAELPQDDLIKDEDGNIEALPVPTKLSHIPPCVAVACGVHQSLALSKDGSVYGWGAAETYALGIGDHEDPVDIPTKIENKATRDYAIKVIACGGQFSCSAGVKR